MWVDGWALELKRAWREKSSDKAQLRRRSHELAEVKTELASLQQEMKAAVELLRKHQSRITASESRVTAQDDRIELLGQQVLGILNGRVWKNLERIGRLPRKLFGRT